MLYLPTLVFKLLIYTSGKLIVSISRLLQNTLLSTYEQQCKKKKGLSAGSPSLFEEFPFQIFQSWNSIFLRPNRNSYFCMKRVLITPSHCRRSKSPLILKHDKQNRYGQRLAPILRSSFLVAVTPKITT